MENANKEYYKTIFNNLNVNHYVELYNAFNVPLIPIKSVGIPSRVFNHWKIKKLLVSEDGKWTKLNFIEYIWLRTIKELRTFDFPIDKIISIKSILFEEPDFSILNKQNNEKDLEKVINMVQTLDIDNEAKRVAIENIKKGKISELLKKEGIHFNMLGSILYRALFFHEEVGIVIYSDGKAFLWVDELYNDKKTKGLFHPPDLFKMPHIYISFSYFLAEFISDDNLEKFISPYSILTAKELEVIRKIREKDVKELIIKFPKGSDNEQIDIITKKKVGLSKEDQHKIYQLLHLGNYQNISLTTQADGNIYIEKSHRKKI